MPIESPRAPSTRGREHWLEARERGMPRYVVMGALRRGIPMALITLVLLEMFEGGTLTRERVLSAAFGERVLFVFTVFFVGGALSSFVRWKAAEALYDGDST